MTPEKPQKPPSPDLFRNRLENLLNQRHELYHLADLIDWSMFDSAFGNLYCPDNGCPANATRLMVGLQYLKHMYGLSDEAVFISGQRRGIKTQRLKCSLKRREAIEPVIGHLKSDGLLGRNYLKGTEGDQMNVMLSCAGHNLRLILRQLRIFCLQLWGNLWALLVSARHNNVVASRDIPFTGTAWQPAINCAQFV